MSIINVSDITTDHAFYTTVRSVRRAEIIPVRASRRITLGDLVGLEFENARTLTFQTQEMVYTERLASLAEVEHEIAAYSRMLPDAHSLVATFFIYLRDANNIKHQLERLQGLHTSVYIEVGSHQVFGIPIPPSDEEADDQTVAVHVLRFTFNDAALATFKDEAIPATVVIEHPAYSDDHVIDVHLREQLIADLH